MIEINFNPFPILRTNRFILNEISENDLDLLYELRTDTEVMKYVGRPLAKNKEEVLVLLNTMKDAAINNTGISWAIRNHNSNEMIGYIGFWRLDLTNHRAEVGYSLLQKHFNNGIATEALHACVDYLFTYQKFHSIVADINPSNIASQKILLKTGFVKEGYFKENYYFDGEYSDTEIYSILKQNFKNKK